MQLAMAAKNYSNIAVETTLASGIAAGALSLVVASASGWPATPFVLVIDSDTASEELILVSGKAGTTFSSLTRGYGGTSDVDHNANAEIKHVIPAEDHRLIWEHNHSGAGGDDTAIVSHDVLSGVSPDDHHAQAHTVASHSDTGATGAQLDTLVGAGDADALHTHLLLATDADLAAHVAAADEHPGYVLNSELTSHAADNDAHGDHASLHAPGGTDALDQYPRGVLGRAVPGTTSYTGSPVEGTPIVNASITVDPGAGRVLKVYLGAWVTKLTSNGFLHVDLYQDSTRIAFGRHEMLLQEDWWVFVQAIVTPTAGSKTFTAKLGGNANNQLNSTEAHFVVEDIGPA